MSDINSQNAPARETIVSALKYFFSSLIYVLFVCPFGFWMASTNRLANDRKNCNLDIIKNESRWPYLSFCKRVFFGFFIDGMTFISWFIGAIVAVIMFFICIFQGELLTAFLSLIGTLIAVYYLPPSFAFIRDMATLMLLPFTKFLSWLSKPAQHLDIDMNKRNVN